MKNEENQPVKMKETEESQPINNKNKKNNRLINIKNEENNQSIDTDNEEETAQINAETAIGDAIDIICQHLETKDLLNVGQVCKSWRDAAWREKIKRFSIQQFRLPYAFNNMNSKLDMNRCVSLLIYDLNFGNSPRNPEDPNGTSDKTEKQLLALLKEKQIQKTIVLLVNLYLTTEEVTFYGARNQCEFLGYFFPNVERRTRVRLASIQNFNPEEIDMQVDRLGEELGFDDCEYPRSTLLLFLSHRRTLQADNVIRKLRKRAQMGEQIEWIGLFGQKLRIVNCWNEHVSKPRVWQDIVALRISGPGVQSFTTFIHCLATGDVIERKLQALREKVKSKRRYAGLISSRKCIEMECSHEEHPCCNCHEIMRRVSRVFPEIPFVGMFQNAPLDLLTAQGNSFGEDDGYYLFLYTSIIIISYD